MLAHQIIGSSGLSTINSNWLKALVPNSCSYSRKSIQKSPPVTYSQDSACKFVKCNCIINSMADFKDIIGSNLSNLKKEMHSYCNEL